MDRDDGLCTIFEKTFEKTKELKCALGDGWEIWSVSGQPNKVTIVLVRAEGTDNG